MNPYLVGAVLASVFLLFVTVLVPFLNPIFNTSPNELDGVGIVIELALIPAMTEELTK